MAIPYALGGTSELFINVPAYGIAYSRAPVNMRGLVSAINLFNTAVAYLIGLACSSVVTDPYLTWDFGGPAIAGGILAVWAYLPNDGPNFPIGHTINLAAQFAALALSSFGIAYCMWENRLRDRGGRDYRLEGLTEEEQADLGYRHPEFRYIA